MLERKMEAEAAMRVESMVRTAVGSVLVVLLLSGAAAAQPRPQPSAAAADRGDVDEEEAKKARAAEHQKKGIAYFNKQQYREASEELRKALELRRTGTALVNLARCLDELGRYDEALERYEELLRDFPAAAPKVSPLVDALKQRMGTVVLAGDAPEGASVFVDDRLRGKLPLAGSLRLASGVHAIRVEKEGFDPITAKVEVTAGQERTAQLTARSRKGLLQVSERHNWPLTVELDGKDVGVTPWEGLVDLGGHRVRLHGTLQADALLSCEVPEAGPERAEGAARGGVSRVKMESEARAADVQLYAVTPVVLGAEDMDTSLKIESTPKGARLRIDAADVGQTPWEGRLGLGEHVIEVIADGFVAAKQSVKLERRKQAAVTIALDRQQDPGSVQSAKTLRNVTVGAAYGLGALGLGVGVVTGVLALDGAARIKERCGGILCPTGEESSIAELRTLSALSTAGFVLAGIGAAGGTVALFALAPPAAGPPKSREEGGASRGGGRAWSVGVGPGRLEIAGSF